MTFERENQTSKEVKTLAELLPGSERRNRGRSGQQLGDIKDPRPPPRIKGAHLRDSSDITDMYEVKTSLAPIPYLARRSYPHSERFRSAPRTRPPLGG